jgi:hypothetical protein
MGALSEGYGAARTAHEAVVAEVLRKEGVVTQELRALGNLLGTDAEFLKENHVTYELINRAIHVHHDRSPVATIHYAADSHEFTATLLFDGSHASTKTAEECAKAIGGMLFTALLGK